MGLPAATCRHAMLAPSPVGDMPMRLVLVALSLRRLARISQLLWLLRLLALAAGLADVVLPLGVWLAGTIGDPHVRWPYRPGAGHRPPAGAIPTFTGAKSIACTWT